jgi:hypothetical protein
MDITRQVRKAINDIRATLEPLCGTENSDEISTAAHKAAYQLDCPPQRRQPWSYFQPRVTEEFGELRTKLLLNGFQPARVACRGHSPRRHCSSPQ